MQVFALSPCIPLECRLQGDREVAPDYPRGTSNLIGTACRLQGDRKGRPYHTTDVLTHVSWEELDTSALYGPSPESGTVYLLPRLLPEQVGP
jgi:hypothetical protein